MFKSFFQRKREGEDKPSLRKRGLYVSAIFVFAGVFGIIAGTVGLGILFKGMRKPASPASPPVPPAARTVTEKPQKPVLEVARQKEIEIRKEKGTLFSARFGPESPESKNPKPSSDSSEKTPPSPKPPILALKENKTSSYTKTKPSVQTSKDMERERLWLAFLNARFSGGAFVPVSEQNREDNATVEPKTYSEEAPSEGINSDRLAFEPYCFVPARVELPTDTGEGARLFARSRRPACGLPAGVLFVGTPRYSPRRMRAFVTFESVKMPDGKVYPIIAEAYMVDDSPGIGSVIKRKDRLKAFLRALAEAGSSAFSVWREDQENAQCVYTENAVICTSRQAKNRLKEALKEGASTFARSLSLLDFVPGEPLVLIEKGLPIKILLLPHGG